MDVDLNNADFSKVNSNTYSQIRDKAVPQPVYATETGSNAEKTSFYCVYSDEYCEQWDDLAVGGTNASVSITLLKPYKEEGRIALASARVAVYRTDNITYGTAGARFLNDQTVQLTVGLRKMVM